jgi:dihydroorotate dehydrogenase (fumarate)
VFSLPSDLTHSPEKDEKLFFDIVDAVKDKVNIPVILKISFYSSNLASLIYQLSKTEISAITLFNRFYSPDIDINTFQVTASNVYSTPGDLALSLRWIALMSDRVECHLSASTGVHDGTAFIKQLLAGATVVQVASAFYKHGKDTAGQILAELEDWMNKHEFQSIADFNGKLSYTKTKNPAAYERTQFMKHFAGKELKL